MKKFCQLVSLAALAVLCSGCASSANWGQVSPWEKGNLAQKKMTFESDVLDQKFIQHIYTSKENSSGGYGVGGGGCGCN
jgi:Flp pilus assembly protein TadD